MIDLTRTIGIVSNLSIRTQVIATDGSIPQTILVSNCLCVALNSPGINLRYIPDAQGGLFQITLRGAVLRGNWIMQQLVINPQPDSSFNVNLEVPDLTVIVLGTSSTAGLLAVGCGETPINT